VLNYEIRAKWDVNMSVPIVKCTHLEYENRKDNERHITRHEAYDCIEPDLIRWLTAGLIVGRQGAVARDLRRMGKAFEGMDGIDGLLEILPDDFDVRAGEQEAFHD
jgi:hypothetical protein